MSLPLAVHHRLDVLTDLATDASATRSEMIGMLIATAELEAGELEQRILAYRKMTVGDVVPATPDGPHDQGDNDNVVTLPLPRPGRPAHRVAG
jgi:hypothetical protein